MHLTEQYVVWTDARGASVLTVNRRCCTQLALQTKLYLWMLQRVFHKLTDVMQHRLNASQIGVANGAGLCIANSDAVGRCECVMADASFSVYDC